jgi:hypothetical protein
MRIVAGCILATDLTDSARFHLAIGRWRRDMGFCIGGSFNARAARETKNVSF